MIDFLLLAVRCCRNATETVEGMRLDLDSRQRHYESILMTKEDQLRKLRQLLDAAQCVSAFLCLFWWFCMQPGFCVSLNCCVVLAAAEMELRSCFVQGASRAVSGSALATA